MYAGHVTAALLLKRAEPKAPTWALLTGTALLDLLFGPLVVVGIEHVSREGFVLPWSHTLGPVLLYSLLFAVPFRARGSRVMAVLAMAVFSHWVLDLCSHGPDIGLWPGTAPLDGFRPWLGGNAGWFETAFTVVGCAIYGWGARRSAEHGRHWPVAIGAVALCYGLEFAVR